MTEQGKKAVILAHDAFGTLKGKTANGLILYEGRYEIVAVIDRGKAGRDAGEVLGVGKKGIPIVGSFEESLKFGPEAFIIGVAPPGGQLPEEWREIIRDAIRNGLDIVNGLHQFFNEDPEFSPLAKKYGTQLYDLRKPPRDLRVAQGEAKNIKIPIVTFNSTDCATGKHVALMEFLKEAKKRGHNPGFVATGQTAMLLNPDAAGCIDAIPMDFVSGEVEKMILEVAAKGKDMIFVEGQGALSQPVWGYASLAILMGSWPTAVILAHDPFRKRRDGFPQFEMPSPNEDIKLIETLCPSTKVVGIVVDGELYQDIIRKSDEEIKIAMERIREETGLPSVDVLRFGASELFDCLLERFKAVKKL